MKSNIKNRLGPVFALVLLPQVATAQAQESLLRTQTLSLESILSTYKQKLPLTALARAQSARSFANAEQDSRTLVGPYRVNLESEVNSSTTGDQRHTVKVMKTIGFGRSKEIATMRHNATAKAAEINQERELQGTLMDVGQMFLRLVQLKMVSEAAHNAALEIAPIVSKGEGLARVGGASHLAVVRWKILLQEWQSTYKASAQSFADLAKSLSLATSVQINEDPTLLQFLPLPNLSFDTAKSLVVRQKELEQEALTGQARQVENQWDLDAGFGVVRETADPKTSFLFEIGIPLGTAAAASSQIHALDAEKDVANFEGQIGAEQLRQKWALLSSRRSQTEARVAILHSKMATLTEILEKAKKAVREGHAEANDVVEMVKDIFETSEKSAEILFEKNQIELEGFLLAKEE